MNDWKIQMTARKKRQEKKKPEKFSHYFIYKTDLLLSGCKSLGSRKILFDSGKNLQKNRNDRNCQTRTALCANASAQPHSDFLLSAEIIQEIVNINFK